MLIPMRFTLGYRSQVSVWTVLPSPPHQSTAQESRAPKPRRAVLRPAWPNSGTSTKQAPRGALKATMEMDRRVCSERSDSQLSFPFSFIHSFSSSRQRGWWKTNALATRFYILTGTFFFPNHLDPFNWHIVFLQPSKLNDLLQKTV